MTDPHHLPRRNFLKQTAAAGAVVAAAPWIARAQNAPRTFRVGLVGCGGRGNGALGNLIEAAKILGHTVQVVAVADFFADRAQGTARGHQVPANAVFSGAKGYQQLVAQPLDIVLLATPPAFRPVHLEAALNAGRHVFIEKPVAVDPAGARKVMELGELAKKKGLSVVAGTQRRHMASYLRNQAAVAAGAVGKILGGTITWCGGRLWYKERQADEADDSYMIRNWTSFSSMSGDHIVEQHVHNIDVANWFLGRTPVSAVGFGGRARRLTGDQFDFFSVDLHYGDDVHIHSMCRQVNGTYGGVGELFRGSEGVVHGGGKLASQNGRKIDLPEFKTHDNGQVQEHIDLLQGIVRGAPLNGAKDVAESTLTAIMGRIACYSGEIVTWADLTTNTKSKWYDFTLSPSPADFENGTVKAPKDNVVPVPGRD